jgi:hypothetical protein
MAGVDRVADAIPARLTPQEGRKFGLTVGGAFLLFGAISRWRGHDTAPYVLFSLGGALVTGGVLIPGALGPVFRAWMGLAHLLSRVTTPLFMGLVYFGVFTPMGVIMRVFGRNPVKHQPKGDSYWVARTPHADPAESMRHQY